MSLKLKQTYADTCIGFNNSSLPLGQRNDLHKLIQLAKEKKLKRWLDMFEEVPDEKQLDKIKEESFNNKQSLKKSE